MGITRSFAISPFAFLKNLLPSSEPQLPALADLTLDDYGILGAFSNGPSVLILGDSITESTGASTYISGYSYMLARSLWNWRDYGFDKDRGFGFQTTVNMTNFANEPGCGWNGTLQPTGLVLNRVTLAAGQQVAVSDHIIDFCDVIYNASNSSGSIVIKLNTTTVATIPVSGSGLQATGPTALGITTSPSDTVTITASGGSLEVCGVLPWRSSTASPTLYVAGKSGTGYQDYTSSAQMDEIAFYLNLQRSTAEKLMIISLGTNNIYNAGKALSPANTVAQLAALVAGIQARCTNINFLVWVPPRSNESLFPVIQANTTYYQYVDAIVSWCRANNVSVLRLDKTQLNRVDGRFLAVDGLHPNTFGHRMIAKEYCRALGILFNPFVNTSAYNQGQAAEARVLIPYNSTWRAFTNNPTFNIVAHRNGNLVTLSGIAEPNGSVSTTIGTLPAGWVPVNRNVDLTCQVSAPQGQAHVRINSTGTIVLDAVPSTSASLEGLTFAINSAYGL